MGSSGNNARNGTFTTLCVMGACAIFSSTMSKNPALNPFSASLGTPVEWSGFVAAASTIPGILISLPAASLSDLLGRRRFLLLAGFVFASAPLTYLLITAWWQLVLVRFYHGFATAFFVPVAEASIAESFPTKRGERISLFTVATYVGRLIAPISGGYILFITNQSASYSNFRELYLVAAAAGAIALFTGFLFSAREERLKAVPQTKANDIVGKMLHGWATVVRDRYALIVSLVQASHYYVYGAFEFFLIGYLTQVLHFSVLIPGLVGTIIIGVAIFTRPYAGRVSDKMGRRIPIIAGCVVSALALVTIPFITDFVGIFALAVVYGIGFAATTSSTSPLISEIVPKELVGTSMGFLDTLMDVGQTLGPIVSGFILATTLGYTGVFLSLAAALMLLCLVFASVPSKRQAVTND